MSDALSDVAYTSLTADQTDQLRTYGRVPETLDL